MFDWLNTYSGTLNFAANAAMVLIWGVYLQFFLRSYRRQTLPKIVINRAAGTSFQASCFISNMSPDAIYVESVLVSVEAGEDRWSSSVTEVEQLQGDDDPYRLTLQGTLKPGEYTRIERFQAMAERVLRTKPSMELRDLQNHTGPYIFRSPSLPTMPLKIWGIRNIWLISGYHGEVTTPHFIGFLG